MSFCEGHSGGNRLWTSFCWSEKLGKNFGVLRLAAQTFDVESLRLCQTSRDCFGSHSLGLSRRRSGSTDFMHTLVLMHVDTRAHTFSNNLCDELLGEFCVSGIKLGTSLD